MAKTCRKIVEDALYVAYDAAHCSKSKKLVQLRNNTGDTVFRINYWLCKFEAEVSDEAFFYFLYPRRVNLSDTWFGTRYADFAAIPTAEHQVFRNAVIADFKALFKSIFNVPYAWEGINWEEGLDYPVFLTDSCWISREQRAPVALCYPEQSMRSEKMKRLMKLQDGWNHIVGYEASEPARALKFEPDWFPVTPLDDDTFGMMPDMTVRN